VIELLRESLKLYGLYIPAEEIEKWFLRKGFLREEENRVYYIGQTHISGHEIFSNLSGFGHPNGRPVMTPLRRPSLVRHLPELLAEYAVFRDHRWILTGPEESGTI